MILDYIWVSEDNSLNVKKRIMDVFDESSLSFYNGFLCKDFHDFVYLMPKKIVKYNDLHYIVLCDTWVYNDKYELHPHISNKRHFCQKEFKLHAKQNEFSIQQEFYLMNNDNTIYGSSKTFIEQNNYCKIGNGNILGRNIVNKTLDECLLLGLNVLEVTGGNGYSQWCFKIKGYDVDIADQIILFRYVLSKVCESYDAYPSFEPMPKNGMNPSGMITEFSTTLMKKDYKYIQEAIKFMSQNHEKNLINYGNNAKRLSLFHKTTFTFGINKSGVSVNIPLFTYKHKKGNIVDYRPASDCNPYVLIQTIMETIDPK